MSTTTITPQVTVETVEAIVGETGKALLRKTRRCAAPKAVRLEKVLSNGTRPAQVYCTDCESWQPAAQVAWGSELRNRSGDIIGTYAALPH